MPNAFRPSPLSYVTTALLDRGQYTQKAGAIELPGSQRRNLRNPLYKSNAEDITSMARFMAIRDPMGRQSAHDYEVLPGGETVYFNGKERELVPYGPGDVPPGSGAQRSLPFDVAFQYREKRPPSSAMASLTFPDDRAVFGHNQTPSTKFNGRAAGRGGY